MNKIYTETRLRMEYAERSWEYELPDRLETALEDDYVENSNLYTENTFFNIRCIYLLCPEIEPEELIDTIRKLNVGTDC